MADDSVRYAPQAINIQIAGPESLDIVRLAALQETAGDNNREQNQLICMEGEVSGGQVEYRQVQRRLARFRDVSREAAQHAWDSLLMWSRQLYETGRSLPAPRVFGNEEGFVEFEWHLPTRQLFVTLVAPSRANVIRLDQTDGRETETESLTDTSLIAEHLIWVLDSQT